jgi:hypothetical protein
MHRRSPVTAKLLYDGSLEATSTLDMPCGLLDTEVGDILDEQERCLPIHQRIRKAPHKWNGHGSRRFQSLAYFSGPAHDYAYFVTEYHFAGDCVVNFSATLLALSLPQTIPKMTLA